MERHPQAITNVANWDEIEPLLDQSLARLKATDRDCVLLRFFQGMSFAEVGASLGLSEEAARKRVTRALEKLRHFFGKEVYLPSASLAGLLTAHAAQTAPAACQAGVAHLTANVLAGHASAALAGSHAYQLTEGVIKAMKIAKLKVLTSSIAVVIVGGAISYGMLQGQTPDQKTAYRTVILTGKARYADGRPAAGVRVAAQVQNVRELMTILMAQKSKPSREKMTKINKNITWTKPDGTYALAVGADLRYNVMVLPNNIARAGEDDGWIAAAAEGMSGHKNQKITVPDLVLERGAFVTGTVTNMTGKPLSNTYVGGYGLARPSTSAESTIGNTYAITDTDGHYRLRVAPGRNQVYVCDSRDGVFLTVATGQTKMVDFHALPLSAPANQAQTGGLAQLVHFHAVPKE